ncbi:MAG: Asp-tRNA(Asn)/Glu-tRNA(Gln) amidotransferase subunit GatA [Tissierellia bacterium]|nr:Asp-tRNA(Asn)/Glu-tRNA(Gln) amidotransferase subunit GatA [Tissierellia bacterium]
MDSINRIREIYISGEKKVEEYIESLVQKIGEDEYNAFITIDREKLIERARELDQKLSEGKELGRLFGIPVALKDNIMTKGMRTTCASKMLENYLPSYDAHIVEKLLEEDAVIIGKTNLDEFAMGGTSETSYFGATKNPIDNSLAPGGSSSGSACSQKLGYSIISIGTDTGGSVRQPAAYCSTIGYLPSYGNISRYGVVSMANSLDQVGIFANNIEDIVESVNIIGGHDLMDPTSTKVEDLKFELKEKSLKGLKIGYIKDRSDYNFSSEVDEDYSRAVEIFKEMGAELIEINFKNQKYLSPTYSVISTAEASSNLSRFDGIRYGYRTEEYDGLEDLYNKTRSEGFGEEVQRRIAIGMYYLGSDFARSVYEKALKVRTLIKREVEELFRDLDIILTPSATCLPPKLGDEKAGTVEAFNSGDFHVIANLTGRCAISIPMREGLGGSVQLMADRYKDEELLNIADSFYREVYR